MTKEEQIKKYLKLVDEVSSICCEAEPEDEEFDFERLFGLWIIPLFIISYLLFAVYKSYFS